MWFDIDLIALVAGRVWFQHDLPTLTVIGLAAVRGDFATAMRLMRPLADQGDVIAQTVVGLMYYFNYGDRVSAYMWFDLAAAQGNAFAAMFLRDTSDKMTPDQIAEAQKLR